jgi:hypothetical protein
MSFWKSITNFLSNPIVRGVSAVTGAAGAAGAFDGFEWGDTLTKAAGVANVATGAASAFDGKQSAFSRALGGAQIGLGGFNILQGGVELPGGNKIGGWGSINEMFKGPTALPGGESSSVSGSGWNVLPGEEDGRLVFSDPLAPPPGASGTATPGTQIYGLGNVSNVSAAPPSTAGLDGVRAAAPMLAPAAAPQLDFQQLQSLDPEGNFGQTFSGGENFQVASAPSAPQGYTVGGAAQGQMPAARAAVAAPAAATPAVVEDRVVAHLPNGVRMQRPDGTFYVASDKSNLTFFQRLTETAMNEPLKAAAVTAAVGGMLTSLFQPSVADIYREMQEKYSPDGANAQQFKAEYKARAEQEARKQHAQLSSQLKATMADRGMADSSVYRNAQAELDTGLTEIVANLDWNAWQAWSQYARSMGQSAAQNAQAAISVAGQSTGFSNVGAMLARM